ncbi:hypothetical protein BS47DRAFT_1396818 [Hydnum rufescens UP504]|uniref:Uncharacterized protein n=1 Tax=Hydnum rufescens UP504 TaxID=1448309 RepID=A0A9P6DTA9_9AGAM|nr:hypothetical protein BS47DRAFT_1396818 [Hydnum rufescens UP504]
MPLYRSRPKRLRLLWREATDDSPGAGVSAVSPSWEIFPMCFFLSSRMKRSTGRLKDLRAHTRSSDSWYPPDPPTGPIRAVSSSSIRIGKSIDFPASTVDLSNQSAEKTLGIQHHLTLHPWATPDLSTASGADPATIVSAVPQPPLEPACAWQYDEIVFTDPPQAFLDILMAHPPTSPKVKEGAIPPNLAHTASLAPQGSRWAPEFTVLLECDDGERLDAAKRSIVEETDKQSALLIEKEQELERLKKELESQ